MIKSFRHKGLRKYFSAGKVSGIKVDQVGRIRMILSRLDSSSEPRDMLLPGLHLHPLKGELKGFLSVRVSGNWRIIFRFENGDAFDVDYIDYH
jgi:proteic killer suppression protein